MKKLVLRSLAALALLSVPAVAVAPNSAFNVLKAVALQVSGALSAGSVSTPSLVLGGTTVTGVGTTSGTLAAGNDSRVVNSLQNDGTGNVSLMTATLPYTGAVPLSIREHLRPRFDVRAFGAKGDGATSDSAAVNSAFLACYAAGGGEVWFPPTGADYRLTTGIAVNQNTCGAVGIGVPNWPGPTGTKAQWTSAGSWISCEDTVNPCLQFNGSGYVRGLNFWHNQPTPSATAGTAWTPNSYPYTVSFKQNFSFAEKINDVNSTNGIIFDYPSNANIAGTYSYVNDFFCGALNTCLRFNNVNDTMSVHNFHQRRLWNIGNSNVTDYFMNNSIGMHIQYLDAAQFTNIEFYEARRAIYFANGTQVYGAGNLTHSCSYCQFSNVLFNQVVQAVDAQYGGDFTSNGTPVPGTAAYIKMSNVVGQTDSDYGRAAGYMFNFGSDRFDVQITDAWFPYVGNSIFLLGAGKGGRLTLSNVRSGQYLPLSNGANASYYNGYGAKGAASPAIVLNKGSVLSVDGGIQELNGYSTAGPKIACGTPTSGAGSNCGTVLTVVPAATPTSP